MLTAFIWALAIVFLVPAVIIAILAIAVCLTYRKYDEERERKYEETKENGSDG